MNLDFKVCHISGDTGGSRTWLPAMLVAKNAAGVQLDGEETSITARLVRSPMWQQGFATALIKEEKSVQSDSGRALWQGLLLAGSTWSKILTECKVVPIQAR